MHTYSNSVDIRLFIFMWILDKRKFTISVTLYQIPLLDMLRQRVIIIFVFLSPLTGFDRLIAEMCGASSIRDVIAFPKTMEGRCMMSGAPGDITNEEKRLYHISVVGDTEPTL